VPTGSRAAGATQFAVAATSGRVDEMMCAVWDGCWVQEKKGQEQMKPEEKEAQRRDYEFQKLEKLLSMVRQPDNRPPPPDDKTASQPPK